MALKLTRLPHGTNRNRTLRRSVDLHDEEVDLIELERLFRRFWHVWQQAEQNEMKEVRT